MATTTQLGYGWPHQQLRARWAPRVERGGVRCGHPQCGQLIAPGTPWHLGHPNDDRSRTPTPWHRRCNIGFKNRRMAQQRRQRQLERRRFSRTW